jgi:hypothetical protein
MYGALAAVRGVRSWPCDTSAAMSFAGLGFRPPSQQQVEFFFSPNEVCQATRMHCLETAFHRSRS